MRRKKGMVGVGQSHSYYDNFTSPNVKNDKKDPYMLLNWLCHARSIELSASLISLSIKN